MFLTVECPDEVFAEASLPVVMNRPGVVLESVEERPAGPWPAVLLDGIDETQLCEWELSAYLVLAARTDTDHRIPHPDGATQIGNLVPNDRAWHNGHTRRQLTVTVDDADTVTWTSVLGQTRTVTAYDYRTVTPPGPGTATNLTDEDDPPPF